MARISHFCPVCGEKLKREPHPCVLDGGAMVIRFRRCPTYDCGYEKSEVQRTTTTHHFKREEDKRSMLA